MPLILAFRRERQEDQKFKARLTYKSKFEPNLDYLSPIFKNTEHYSSSGGTHPELRRQSQRNRETLPHKTNQRNKNPTKML